MHIAQGVSVILGSYKCKPKLGIFFLYLFIDFKLCPIVGGHHEMQLRIKLGFFKRKEKKKISSMR